MPNPQMRPQRTVNGETREWDGSQWVPIGADGGAPPRAPMVNVPRAPYSPEQQQSIKDRGNWLLKNLLMTGGMMAGGALTGGVIPLIAGAAAGRAAGAVPEIALSDDPNKLQALLKEAGTGAMEGLEGEVGARTLGPALKYGGRGLQKVGTVFGDIPSTGAGWRTGGIGGRAALGHYLGLGPGGTAALALGPPVATEVGKLAERTGLRLAETPGLAEPLQESYEALKRRIWPRGVDPVERMPVPAADWAVEPPSGPRTTWNVTREKPFRMGGSTSYDTPAGFPGPDATPPLTVQPRVFRPQADPTELRPDLNRMLEETELGQQLKDAGFERNAAVKIAEGKGTAEGSSLPRPTSWNPSEELGQPYGGMTLSDRAARILNTEPTPWSPAPNLNALRSRAIPNAPPPTPARDVLMADDLANLGQASASTTPPTPGTRTLPSGDVIPWSDTPPYGVDNLGRPLTDPRDAGVRFSTKADADAATAEPLPSRQTTPTSSGGGLKDAIKRLDDWLAEFRKANSTNPE